MYGDNMKILFMGTPDYALEILKKLYDSGDEIVGVVTQPDKPKGRGYKMIPPPVKVFAIEKDIPVYQPQTLKDGAFRDTLDMLGADMIIVAAYGKILPGYVIDHPPLGCICAHASLLPKYRGAAPIQRAVLEGETKTGVTAMFIDEGIDTGDMIFKEEIDILPEDDFEAVHDKLAAAGAKVILRTVSAAKQGPLPREKQDESLSNYAGKITKEDRVIDFSKSAADVVNKVRGLCPFPRAFTFIPGGNMLQITKAVKSGEKPGVPGEVVSADSEGFTVSCSDGCVKVLSVIPEGKGAMGAADYVRGRKINVGDILGNEKQ